MINMKLSEAAKILGVTAPTPDSTFQGISIDSRTLQPGNLFIAIHGETTDGHHFLANAAQKNAAAAILDHPIASPLPQLIVKDTTQALGQLSTAWRKHFTLPIVAVTGSNGKTTLKNMIASIFKAACDGDESAVLATQGTLNNHWGLPLTLARLSAKHRYAAIEMGMNHFGEIAYLTQLTKPTVAVITNAAESHLAGLENVAGVARAKGEIFQGLAADGIAVLNKNDAFFTPWCQIIGNRRYLSFGLATDADVTATITPQQTILAHTPSGDIEIKLPLLGKHNVMNALAATAAALAVGVNLAAIKTGLENVQPAPGRLNLRFLPNGSKLIDDSYNANPFSLQAAVDTLASFAGTKILVLGDMKELGAEEQMLHQSAGEKIRSAGIDYLFTYGRLTAHTAKAFGEKAFHFTEQETLLDKLKPFLQDQTTVLVKGSRSMKMEKVVAGLVGNHQHAH